MILGDSLQVMAPLAEREGLRGKVQCIYIDPPYGIKFNSNFQWSITSRDVRDGKADHITREPEQVKALRDTWRDGVHSYLTYLRAPGLHGGSQPGAVEAAQVVVERFGRSLEGGARRNFVGNAEPRKPLQRGGP